MLLSDLEAYAAYQLHMHMYSEFALNRLGVASDDDREACQRHRSRHRLGPCHRDSRRRCRGDPVSGLYMCFESRRFILVPALRRPLWWQA
jgi:hypothetical protein